MLSFIVEWAPPGPSPTQGVLLKYFVEALTAFGWETVWTEEPHETSDRKRRVFRPDRAEELMSASVFVGTHPFQSEFLLRVYTMEQNLTDGKLLPLTPLPVAGRVDPSARPRLYAGAPIPRCSRDEATRILRRLVHLSAPRFAAVGVTRHIQVVVPTLLYLDSSGRSWFEKYAAHVRLSSESTGGAWLLAHGEDLTSETDQAKDANEAMKNTFRQWYEETSKPTPTPRAAPTGRATPGTQTPERNATSTSAPRTAAFDPDATVPPTPFLGPILPFAKPASSNVAPHAVVASDTPEQSGETVALGELPLLVRGFSLPRYARLRAALSKYGEEHTPTLAAFGLDASSKQALQHAFVEVFQSRPDLVSQFTQLVALAKLRQGDHG